MLGAVFVFVNGWLDLLDGALARRLEGAVAYSFHPGFVPGSAFGTPGYARISYAASAERLNEAVDRLEEHDYL